MNDSNNKFYKSQTDGQMVRHQSGNNTAFFLKPMIAVQRYKPTDSQKS